MPGFKEIDSPVQMRLYTLTKHQFVLVFVAFAGAFGISIIIGFVGPAAIGEQTKTVKQLGVSPKNYKTGPFILNSGLLTQFNQELWLFCKFHLSGLPFKKGYEVNQNFHMTVKILGSSKDTSYKLITHAFRNRTRTLKCTADGCDSIVVFHLGTLDYPSYLVNLTIYGLNLPRTVKIRNVVFTFKYYEDQFTQMEIWFRFAFLVLSFTVTCVFAHSLRKFPVRDWCIEQRWMSALLPLLLLYNNPLFPLNFLVQSWVPELFDAIFQASFFSALLMFWLCVYHGIRQTERKFLSFYLPKVIIVGLIWATGCSLLAWQDLNEVRDPSYQYKVDTGHFVGLKIFFFVMATIYLAYLLFLLIQAFRELRNVPCFGMRLKFLTGLMLVVVFIRFLGSEFCPMSSAPASVAHFFVRVFLPAEFLAFYGLFNLYLYTMTYVYSPSTNAIRDARIKAMPAAFTMLPDTKDEEILYNRKDLTGNGLATTTEHHVDPEEEEKKATN